MDSAQSKVTTFEGADVLSNRPAASMPDVPAETRSASGARSRDPAAARERPPGGNGDPQLVFTNVLLSVVGAYSATGSVAVTVIAAVVAVLVTILVKPRR
ncbi:hypothetical protein [Actinomadura luteofluorescens]